MHQLPVAHPLCPLPQRSGHCIHLFWNFQGPSHPSQNPLHSGIHFISRGFRDTSYLTWRRTGCPFLLSEGRVPPLPLPSSVTLAKSHLLQFNLLICEAGFHCLGCAVLCPSWPTLRVHGTQSPLLGLHCPQDDCVGVFLESSISGWPFWEADLE